METTPENFEERLEQIIKHRSLLGNDQNVGGHSGNKFYIGSHAIHCITVYVDFD